MRVIDADAIAYESIDSSDTGRHVHYYGTGIIAVRKEDIDEMPTIQPEPHWIPVDLENNEPQLEEWVLVSSDGYVMQDCIVERGGKKIWYHGGNIQADDRYMPLPEPYKPTVPPECEGDCGWCKTSVIEKCKEVTT